MTKLNKVLIVLLLLQIGILAISRLSGSKDQPGKSKKLLPALDVKKIVKLKILDDEKKTVVLARQGDGWALESGAGYPAKKEKLKELLEKLPALTAGPPVSNKPAHHRAFEVADDKFQRDVTLSLAGGKEIRFFLGTSPLIRRVHLRFAGKNAVYLASELSAWDINTSASSWVETEYLKLARDKVVSLALSNEHGKIELSKGEGGKWALAPAAPAPGAKPPETPEKLKQSEVDSLLSTVSTIHLEEPVSSKIEPAHGLGKPAATIEIVSEEELKTAPAKKAAPASAPASQAVKKVRRTARLMVGGKKGNSYYAKRQASKYVVLIGSWAAEALTKKKRADLLEKPKTGGDGGPAKDAGP